LCFFLLFSWMVLLRLIVLVFYLEQVKYNFSEKQKLFFRKILTKILMLADCLLHSSVSQFLWRSISFAWILNKNLSDLRSRFLQVSVAHSLVAMHTECFLKLFLNVECTLISNSETWLTLSNRRMCSDWSLSVLSLYITILMAICKSNLSLHGQQSVSENVFFE